MSLNIAKHKNILIKILKDIFTDLSIAPFLGFKGGMAALLFYGLDRFSVDLDFDLMDQKEVENVYDRIKSILESYGQLKEARQKRFNLFYVLSYDNKDVNAQNIKVEINRCEFGSKYEVRSYLGIAMNVMIREDMAAHKMVAMYERIGKTNRDIFDIWFFLQNNWPINKKIVEARTKMPFKKFLEKSIHLLEKGDHKDILSGMGEILNKKQKDWVREKLLAETIFLLKLALENER